MSLQPSESYVIYTFHLKVGFQFANLYPQFCKQSAWFANPIVFAELWVQIGRLNAWTGKPSARFKKTVEKDWQTKRADCKTVSTRTDFHIFIFTEGIKRGSVKGRLKVSSQFPFELQNAAQSVTRNIF